MDLFNVLDVVRYEECVKRLNSSQYELFHFGDQVTCPRLVSAFIHLISSKITNIDVKEYFVNMSILMGNSTFIHKNTPNVKFVLPTITSKDWSVEELTWLKNETQQYIIPLKKKWYSNTQYHGISHVGAVFYIICSLLLSKFRNDDNFKIIMKDIHKSYI